jgi:hypothetical protein
VILDILAAVEHLFHLIEELIVLVLHLPPRWGVHPHCFIIVDEVIDLEAIRLVNFDSSMGNNIANTEEKSEELN